MCLSETKTASNPTQLNESLFFRSILSLLSLPLCLDYLNSAVSLNVTYSELPIDRSASTLSIYPLGELQAEAFSSAHSLFYSRMLLLVSILTYLPGNSVL